MRFDEHGPLDAFNEILSQAAVEALERGVEEYGNTWMNHLRADKSPLWNADHTIDRHAQTRIKQALERLDYGDTEGFIAYLGSAVGYLANAVCKAVYLDGDLRAVHEAQQEFEDGETLDWEDVRDEL
jgi:hypothetical protein